MSRKKAKGQDERIHRQVREMMLRAQITARILAPRYDERLPVEPAADPVGLYRGCAGDQA